METNTYVTRHQWRSSKSGDPALLAKKLEYAEGVIHVLKDQMREWPEAFDRLIGQSLREAGLLQVLRPHTPEIRTALSRAAWAVKSVCALVSPGQGPVTVGLSADDVFEAPRIQNNNFFNVVHFIRGFFIAMAARETTVLDALVQVDVSRLRVPGVSVEDYTYHWARSLQGLHLGGAPWLAQEFLAALEGTDPEKPHINLGYVLNIACMQMELFTALREGPEQFNAVLVKALEAHKFYFGQIELVPGEDQSNDPLGYIALGPLAFAATAAAHGWPITTRSDYLPDCLIDGAA